MYNKLFTAILDSSIWLEPDATRIVWVTLIAAMDETGFARFAAVENLAGRARVSVRAAAKAVETLEAPDLRNPGQDDDGRRIERVPGGWVVRNAIKYRTLVTRALQRDATRERVRRHRARNRRVTDTPLQQPQPSENGHVNGSHVTLSVTPVKRAVTQSEAEAEAEAEKKNVLAHGFDRFWTVYPRRLAKKAAFAAWKRVNPDPGMVESIIAAVNAQMQSVQWVKDDGQFIPHPATWLNGRRWNDEVVLAVAPSVRLSPVSARIHSTLSAAARIMAEPDVPGTDS